MKGLVVDLFAGGGGASVAIREALGREPDVAINHWSTALAVHKTNHPATRHLEADLWEVHPLEVTRGRRVDLLWASPDCKHHSRCKGGKPRDNRIRGLAWVAVEWARAVRPRIVCVENVPEFAAWGPLDEHDKPIKERAGETFRAWVGELRLLGYEVDWRVLDASEYGAPTRRRRIFIVARCDGQPIVWPTPTHGPGLLPFRAAAECINWARPCPSIFTRKKPLCEKTQWRIAMGIWRFVIEDADPFVIDVNHGKWEPRGHNIRDPFPTVTASRRGHAVIAPVLQHSGNGERRGQRARVYDIREPIGTVVAGGQKHALVAAFLAKHYGDPLRRKGGGVVLGSRLRSPIGTVTAKDHHSLVTSTLCKLRGQCHSSDVREPMPTITAGGGRGGGHVAEVRAFLTAYYKSDGNAGKGQSLREPMRTVTAKHRFGIVTVHGVDYQIADIGFRMVEDDELLPAQFGDYAVGYDLSEAKTKADRVALIGNSVSPPPAIALLRANLPEAWREAA